MKKALITGITGQDGSYLAEFLLEKGYEVHGIVRRASLANTARIDSLIEKNSITLHDGDLTDGNSLYHIMATVRPDEIYNLAAQSHVQNSFSVPIYTGDVDALGVTRILDTVHTLGMDKSCRIYQASTSELYGKVEEVPQNENTPFHPFSPYAVAKQYGFWMMKEYREAYGQFAANGILFNHESERGKEVEEGTTIGVVISNGKGSVAVPNVTGDSEDDAVSALEKEGFKPNKTYAYDDSVEEGKVISQTPSAGDKAKTGDTITIVISQGAEAVTVPDVKTTYKSEDQAKALLTDFNVTVKTAYSDTLPEGIVMDQSIDPGKQVEKGSDITITVSMGPSPSQSVTATTYSFKATINLPGDTSNVSGATITLYDTSGNVLGQWDKAITDDFSISKTGLLAKEGYLVISWLDLNGNKINDQTTSTYQFTPES